MVQPTINMYIPTRSCTYLEAVWCVRACMHAVWCVRACMHACKHACTHVQLVSDFWAFQAIPICARVRPHHNPRPFNSRHSCCHSGTCTLYTCNYTHVHMYTIIHNYKNTCTHVHVYMYTCTCVHVYMLLHIYMYTCTRLTSFPLSKSITSVFERSPCRSRDTR